MKLSTGPLLGAASHGHGCVSAGTIASALERKPGTGAKVTATAWSRSTSTGSPRCSWTSFGDRQLGQRLDEEDEPLRAELQAGEEPLVEDEHHGPTRAARRKGRVVGTERFSGEPDGVGHSRLDHVLGPRRADAVRVTAQLDLSAPVRAADCPASPRSGTTGSVRTDCTALRPASPPGTG